MGWRGMRAEIEYEVDVGVGEHGLAALYRQHVVRFLLYDKLSSKFESRDAPRSCCRRSGRVVDIALLAVKLVRLGPALRADPIERLNMVPGRCT